MCLHSMHLNPFRIDCIDLENDPKNTIRTVANIEKKLDRKNGLINPVTGHLT